MLTQLPRIDYTARDYETIVAALTEHVRLYFGNDWQDFASSNLGMAFLQLVAYVGDQLNFYVDQQANEQYLPTAVQRPNVVRLAQTLGYIPRTAAAATVPLRLRVATPQADATVIEAYTRVRDKSGVTYETLEVTEIAASVVDTFSQAISLESLVIADGATTVFSLQAAHDTLTPGSATLRVVISAQTFDFAIGTDGVFLLPNGGSGLLDHDTGRLALSFDASALPAAGSHIRLSYAWTQQVYAYEGTTRVEQFSGDGTANKSWILPGSPVLVDPMVVDEIVTPSPTRIEFWIGDPAAPFGTATGELWTRVDSLLTASSDDAVFEVVVNDDDTVTLKTGDGTNGRIPPSGVNNIHVIYRVGGGLRGNVGIDHIDTSVVGLSGVRSVTVRVNNYAPGTGGLERESADEIRRAAPRFIRTNDTATTEQDFDSLSTGYVLPSGGVVARAKARLEPALVVASQWVQSGVEMIDVGASPTLEYFVRVPAAPIIPSTLLVSYFHGSVPNVASANDLGGGIAEITGTNVDASLSRIRIDATEVVNAVPPGFSGDGVIVTFDGATSAPVMPSTFILAYVIDGTEFIAYDDGNGEIIGANIYGPSASGNGEIDYVTGDIRVRFGTQATILSQNVGPYDLNAINAGGAVDLDVEIDGVPATITFNSGHFSSYTAATAAEVAARINTVLGATIASDDGGAVRLTATTYGEPGSLRVVSGNANDATDGFDFDTAEVTGESFAPDNGIPMLVSHDNAMRLVFTTIPDAMTVVVASFSTGPNTITLPTNNIQVYAWAYDTFGGLVPASAALRDGLKTYLDLRRVLATSVEVLGGYNVEASFALTVTYDPAASRAETNARIRSALEAFFASATNVEAGDDVPLAAVYRALYPLVGVQTVVVQAVSLLVPVGRGNGGTARFRSDAETPGHHVSTNKLPMRDGVGAISILIDGVLAGTSDAATPTAGITSVGAAMLPGSTVRIDSGAFDLRFTAAPGLDAVVAIEFQLDESESVDGLALWNIGIEPWEIATLRSVTVNGLAI